MSKKISPNSKKSEKEKKVAKKIPVDLLMMLALILLTWFAYIPSFGNTFTNWDDQFYILKNALIRDLSLNSIREIFSTYIMGNYHPLTMLSFAIEFHFFELDPWIYHLTNFILHLANVLLVFVFIKAFLNEKWVAFIGALLFAVHPMHVESVAWISERKDVLYTLFFLLALCSYIKYVRGEGKNLKMYLLTLLFFLLSCFSKGMAVSLPVVLLLLDFFLNRDFSAKVLLEKIPFFIFSVVLGIVAVFAQRSTDAFEVKHFEFFERILFSSYGFLLYLVKIFLPFNLACFYDYPSNTGGSYPFIYYVSPLIVAVLPCFTLLHGLIDTKTDERSESQNDGIFKSL